MASYLGIQFWVADILKRQPPRRTWLGAWNPCNEKDSQGCTPLHYAANQGFDKIVALLIRHGADAGISDNYMQTVSTTAAEAGHENAMRALLDNGVDPNDCVLGETLLHCAAKEGHAGMVQLLLERGALIDTETTSNGTPLHVAIVRQRVEVIELLLKSGADVNVTDSEGRTALHLELQCSGNRPQLIRLVNLLLEKGAKIEAKDNSDNTPLHTCVLFTSKDISGAVTTLLLKHKADANAEMSGGETALHAAIRKGNFTAAQALIQHNANVNAKIKDGDTGLHVASRKGHIDVAELLLNSGASVDARDALGQTPLLCTTDLRIVELLLDHRADINALGRWNRTVLHNMSPLKREVTVKLLLEKGANVNARDFDDATPLHDSVSGSEAVMKVLLTHDGVDVNARNKNEETALHLAAKGEKQAMVQLLLEHGADVNAKDLWGATALSNAWYNYERERSEACGKLITTLLANKANFDLDSEYGREISQMIQETTDHGVPMAEWCSHGHNSMQQPTTASPTPVSASQTGFASLLRTAFYTGRRS